MPRRNNRPMFRGRDLTAGPVIGYGSQPIGRRRARIRAWRIKAAAVIAALGVLSFMFGNNAIALLQSLITPHS